MPSTRPTPLVRVSASAAILIGAWALAGWAGAPDSDDRAPVHVMHVEGTIDLGLAPYVERAVEEAEQDGAAALVIEIDTPGGRVDAVIQMRDAIVDTDVRTIALVDASAFSAGALVAIAADEIYMTPGAVIGAATPVLGGTGEVADEKTISAVRATFASTAEENGRDPTIAEAMVDTRVVVEGLVGDDELLTLTTAQALEYGYADGRVADLDALLAELGLADRRLVDTRPGLAEQFVRILTHPVVAGLLLLGGFLLIVGDFLGGGVGIAALGGLALLAAFFWGHRLAGLAGWEDLALVALGIVLLAVEVFVIPGFGVAGVLGIVSLGAGAFLAMISRDLDLVSDEDLFRAGLTVGFTLVAAVIGVIVLIAALSRHGAPKGLVLSTRLAGGRTIHQRTSAGWLGWFGADDRLEPDRVERPAEPDERHDGSLLGAVGVAVSDLRPGGIAEIEGRRVDVVTSGEFLPAGEPVEVIRDDRYRRIVHRRR